MLYAEYEFPERYAAAAADGFEAVECLFPYAYNSADLARRLQENKLRQVLFNAPPGDWDAGERGLACLPGREAEFRAGLLKALEYAEALDCPRLHVMAGVCPAGVPQAQLRATYLANLRWAAETAAKSGRVILIEPLNTRDMPGYFLTLQEQAHQIVMEVGAGNLKVQMDLYHCQIMEGDITTKLRKYLPSGRIGHLQIAGVPERHEPDFGELNYQYLFDLIYELSLGGVWEGWIGCEYRPGLGQTAGATSSGLDWFRRVLAEE